MAFRQDGPVTTYNNLKLNKMKKKIVDGHMTVTAGVGKFVGFKDRSVFGKTLSLGCETKPEDLIEEDEEMWPKIEEEEVE